MTDVEQPTGPIVKGKVKWFNIRKGFGFIERDDESDDVHVHFSGITLAEDSKDTFATLGEGESVEFVVGKDKSNRDTAVRVTGPDGGAVEGARRRRRRRPRSDRTDDGASPREPREKQAPGVCYNFQDSGACKFGDECRFSHDLTDAPDPSTRKPKSERRRRTRKPREGEIPSEQWDKMSEDERKAVISKRREKRAAEKAPAQQESSADQA